MLHNKKNTKVYEKAQFYRPVRRDPTDIERIRLVSRLANAVVVFSLDSKFVPGSRNQIIYGNLKSKQNKTEHALHSYTDGKRLPILQC